MVLYKNLVRRYIALIFASRPCCFERPFENILAQDVIQPHQIDLLAHECQLELSANTKPHVSFGAYLNPATDPTEARYLRRRPPAPAPSGSSGMGTLRVAEATIIIMISISCIKATTAINPREYCYRDTDIAAAMIPNIDKINALQRVVQDIDSSDHLCWYYLSDFK